MRTTLVAVALSALAVGVAHAQEARPAAAVARNYEGATLLKAGKVAEAITEFQAAIELAPSYCVAQANLAFALDRQGRTDEAISAYRRALDLDASNVVLRNNLGTLLSRQGQYAEAAREFEDALRREPANPTAKTNLDIAKRNMTVMKEREDQIGRALTKAEARPTDSRAAYDVARIYGQQGDADHALTWIAKALELGYEWLDFVPVDPAFATLKKDPRFARVLEMRPPQPK